MVHISANFDAARPKYGHVGCHGWAQNLGIENDLFSLKLKNLRNSMLLSKKKKEVKIFPYECAPFTFVFHHSLAGERCLYKFSGRRGKKKKK